MPFRHLSPEGLIARIAELEAEVAQLHASVDEAVERVASRKEREERLEALRRRADVLEKELAGGRPQSRKERAGSALTLALLASIPWFSSVLFEGFGPLVTLFLIGTPVFIFVLAFVATEHA